jgi:hypothetical protein
MIPHPDNIQADRQIMAELMDKLDEATFGICTCCKQEGIILTAVNKPDVKACWVCIKNEKVVNPTGLGFA